MPFITFPVYLCFKNITSQDIHNCKTNYTRRFLFLFPRTKHKKKSIEPTAFFFSSVDPRYETKIISEKDVLPFLWSQTKSGSSHNSLNIKRHLCYCIQHCLRLLKLFVVSLTCPLHSPRNIQLSSRLQNMISRSINLAAPQAGYPLTAERKHIWHCCANAT